MKPLLLAGCLFWLVGCTSYRADQIEQVAYFPDLASAPAYDQVGWCECYGFSGLFRMPTFESAQREAQREALRRGGDAIILVHTMRAVDLPDAGIDPIQLVLDVYRSPNKDSRRAAISATLWEELTVEADDQLVWFFKLVRLHSRSIDNEKI